MATPTKFGPEFLINTTTLRAQYHPALTALADGRFVCLWTDDSATGADTTGSAVRGQIFNANGSTSGAEFLVNTTTSNDQNDPVLTTLANGRFVAAWTDYSTTGADTSFQAIRAQVFNADGSRFGAEFLVNTRTPGNQSDQSMTALTGGGFVVSWTDFSQIGGDQADTAVRAQVFNANGSKSGAEFQVNTTTAGYQTASHLTALSNGDFVAVWQDSSLTGADTSGDAIRAQIFTADGNMLGAEFLVNTTTLNSQSLPVVTALANGRFVAAWGDLSATGADSSVSAVRAQVFNADGSLSGSEFLVNTTTFSSQLNPSLTALADGRFVAVWTDYSQTGGDLSGTAIRAQVINADGSLSGAEFLVNTATFFYQYNPTLTVLADGRLMVAWSDLSQTGGDMDAYAVRGQIFDPRIAAVNLAGTLANDQYTGTQFNDTMSGAAGNDTLTGGNGADWLYGGAGRDHLSGGNGSDHLFGGIGKDILTGGANADVFVFRTAAEAGNGTQGDRITDFTSGADKIDLSTFMAGGQFIGATAFHATGGMEVRYIAASHILQGDADGNGTIDFSLQLDGVAALSSSDFIF